MEKTKSISKVLSANDIGLTGGHQAGILVPKREEILGFFPNLDKAQKNPRFLLTFLDTSHEKWDFSFIYYNNSFFGGTRNEFRLTRMTKYFKANNLKVGDELFLVNEFDGLKYIWFKRALQNESGKLRLSSEWKVIQI